MSIKCSEVDLHRLAHLHLGALLNGRDLRLQPREDALEGHRSLMDVHLKGLCQGLQQQLHRCLQLLDQMSSDLPRLNASTARKTLMTHVHGFIFDLFLILLLKPFVVFFSFRAL